MEGFSKKVILSLSSDNLSMSQDFVGIEMLETVSSGSGELVRGVRVWMTMRIRALGKCPYTNVHRGEAARGSGQGRGSPWDSPAIVALGEH